MATKLMGNGMDVNLDQWDLGLGDDAPKFMEKSVTEADRVLMICTETYVHRANEGSGDTPASGFPAQCRSSRTRAHPGCSFSSIFVPHPRPQGFF